MLGVLKLNLRRGGGDLGLCGSGCAVGVFKNV